MSGWLMSSALMGCIGGAMAGWLIGRPLWPAADTGIRRGSVRRMCGRQELANNAAVFAMFRIVGGIGIGLASGLSPLYIGGVSPARNRGLFVAINQLTIVIGVLLAQLVDMWIARSVPGGLDAQELRHSWNVQNGWRWMFAGGGVPAALFLLLVLVIPECLAG